MERPFLSANIKGIFHEGKIEDTAVPNRRGTSEETNDFWVGRKASNQFSPPLHSTHKSLNGTRGGLASPAVHTKQMNATWMLKQGMGYNGCGSFACRSL